MNPGGGPHVQSPEQAPALGQLQQLMDDPQVGDILVNRFDLIYVEKDGRLEQTNITLPSDADLLGMIENIAAWAGRPISYSRPMLDARLPDGSRVNAIIPPLAVDGPALSIRKFPSAPLTTAALIELGALDAGCAGLLEAMVQARLNILISGGTGSGKTTLLGALSSFIPQGERIITIEDAAELRLLQRHVVRLETRPPDAHGQDEVTMRDLVRNALRMRPDRIVVGEVRGGEALDMLQAMNTGHEGSLATLHANSPREALTRLEIMVSMAGLDIPRESLRWSIASTLDLIIQTARFSDGSRRLVSLQEVTGMEGSVVTMQEIFSFTQSGVDDSGKVLGRFESAGLRPRCLDKIQAMGIELDMGWLSN